MQLKKICFLFLLASPILSRLCQAQTSVSSTCLSNNVRLDIRVNNLVNVYCNTTLLGGINTEMLPNRADYNRYVALLIDAKAKTNKTIQFVFFDGRLTGLSY